jgi:hypothetical protein
MRPAHRAKGGGFAHGKGGCYTGQGEDFHVAEATRQNRLILNRVFKPLSSRVTGVRMTEMH